MSALPGDGRTRRFGEKRDAIVHAATELFNRHGVRGATLADVAASVGLATNSVTYYYRRKETLAGACFLRSIDAFRGIAAQAAARPSAEARIAEFVRLHVALLTDVGQGRRPPLMLFNDVRALGAPQADAVFAAYTEMFRDVRALLGDALPGASRADLNARAHLLLSVPNWMRAWLDRYEPDERARVAERVADILLGGIAPRGATRRADAAGAERDWLLLSDAERAADAFLRAATVQVNEQGYRGASVERISARLNLTKGSFYHHHEHKDDLISACFERTFTVIRRALALAQQMPGDGWTRCAAAARALVAFQLSEDGPLLRTSATTALPDEIHRQQVRRTMRGLAGRLSSIIADGIIDGSIRPVDAAIAADIGTGTINAAAELQRWVPGADRDNAARLFVRPLLEGLLCDAAPGHYTAGHA